MKLIGLIGCGLVGLVGLVGLLLSVCGDGQMARWDGGLRYPHVVMDRWPYGSVGWVDLLSLSVVHTTYNYVWVLVVGRSSRGPSISAAACSF